MITNYDRRISNRLQIAGFNQDSFVKTFTELGYEIKEVLIQKRDNYYYNAKSISYYITNSKMEHIKKSGVWIILPEEYYLSSFDVIFYTNIPKKVINKIIKMKAFL